MSERTIAVLDGNIVQNVIVVTAEYELEDGQIEYTDANPAGIGWEYDGTGFIPPQPYPSWVLTDYQWQPPTPLPDDGNAYWWDEDNTTWQLAD